MNDWLALLIADCFFPLLVLLNGVLFYFITPSHYYSRYGFRNGLSTKSKDTWEFSQKYAGKLCFKMVLIVLPLTIAIKLLMVGQSLDILGPTTAIIVTVQIVFYFLIMLCLPNREIRKYFDENGKRKEEQ